MLDSNIVPKKEFIDKMVSVLTLMDKHFKLTEEGISKTFLGQQCLTLLKTPTKESVVWIKLTESAKTVGDLWWYFILVNNIEMLEVEISKEYNDKFFRRFLETPIMECNGFKFIER